MNGSLEAIGRYGYYGVIAGCIWMEVVGRRCPDIFYIFIRATVGRVNA